ncbi:MAG: HTH domain-containing protein [Halapricum sp.]
MTPRTDTHLELYLRTQTPAPISRRLAALRSELAALALDHGWSFGVTFWPTKIEFAPRGSRDSIAHHVYDLVTEWAARNGASLDPAFETRRCYSWETGEPYEALVLPVACLVVERDGDLASVYPHCDETGVHTIAEAITALQTTEQPRRHGRADESSKPVRTTP